MPCFLINIWSTIFIFRLISSQRSMQPCTHASQRPTGKKSNCAGINSLDKIKPAHPCDSWHLSERRASHSFPRHDIIMVGKKPFFRIWWSISFGWFPCLITPSLHVVPKAVQWIMFINYCPKRGCFKNFWLTITKRLPPRMYDKRMSGTIRAKPRLVPTPRKSSTPKVRRRPSFPNAAKSTIVTRTTWNESKGINTWNSVIGGDCCFTVDSENSCLWKQSGDMAKNMYFNRANTL